MTKNEIRASVLEKRSSIAEYDRDLWDQLIFERAHKHKAFQLASVVHVYSSMPEEVESTPFIEYAWGIGKDVYVPVSGPNGLLTHCRITWRTQWGSGPFGIREPIPDSPESIITDHSFFGQGAAIIVPLVAFDQTCARVGYGKGFYDRFLAEATATKIGIAYELQRVQHVPGQEHDIPMDAIATQERWYKPQ
ncbi:MAG: 5-formyltetrahydrofolate cyclo-ligase [Ignavibacteria bacterium]